MLKKIELSNRVAMMFGIVVGLISLLPRLLNPDLGIDQLLRNEDGPVFINQSILGIQSLWEPYAGYLHLYPRIVAWIASGFALEATPFILTLGWFLTFVLLVVVIMDRALKTGLGPWGGMILVALISLQPHGGEVFLNITNAQWLLGIALALYLLVDGQKKPSYLEMILLFVVCLTGPFVVLLLPVFLLRGFIFKEFKKRSITYLIVLVCALVQIIIFLNSERRSEVDGRLMNTDIMTWLQVFAIFIVFQKKGYAILGPLIFWLGSAYVGIRSLFASDPSVIRDRNTAFLLVIAAGIIFLAGALGAGPSPLEIGPFAAGSRYYMVPYGLLFFAIGLLAYPFKYVRLFLSVTLFVLCITMVYPLNRPPLQFYAFAEFAKHNSDVIIPILNNNQRNWHVKGSVAKPAQNPVKPFRIYELPNTSHATNWCPDSQYVGLEVNMMHKNEGWVKAYWSTDNNFSAQNALERYYPVGLMDIYIAFPNTEGPLFFKLDGQAQINWIDIYCLGN
ncbi:MAG: hypothetical protein ABSF18_05280 [Gammaproteobacteria bacterium]